MPSETTQLITTIKRLLKSQGLTYSDLAEKLKLSEPTVKRLFASGRLTVERLEQISHLLGYTLAELSREAVSGQARLDTLTAQQERELVSDTKLLVVAVCALNHWAMAEITEIYRITEQECLKCLLHLDKLRIIELLPGNRIRLNVSRDFDWLPGGPIRQYFQARGLNDFLKSSFAKEDEAMAFVYGMFTDQAMAQIKDELRRLRQKFSALHEDSLAAPLNKRQGLCLLFAMRNWLPDDFAELRR